MSDKCESCGGRLALTRTSIEQLEPDQEPFEAGICEEIAPISTTITVWGWVCATCGEPDDLWYRPENWGGEDQDANLHDFRKKLALAKKREAALQKVISAQDEQLLSVCRERDTEKARAEKAEREADRVRAVALKQYEYALEESARLRDASLPVAKQLDEPIVMGADKSQCRLVPVGLLLTLREALAAKPKVPSAAEEETPNDA